MPRRERPWVVGCPTMLDERRKRLKPGTWRSRSSTVWLAEWVTSSRVMTVTAAGASPAFCSIRVGVTTTGSRRAGASGVCAAAGATRPTTSTRTRTAPVICTGVREAGVNRGWPETGARRSFVPGSARPACTVGGLRQARVAHLRDMVALRTPGWYPLALSMMLVRALVLLHFVAYLVTLPPHLLHHLFEHSTAE